MMIAIPHPRGHGGRGLVPGRDVCTTRAGIVTLTESGGQQPQPLYMDGEMALGGEMDTMAKTPVLPGEVELSVSVFIQYEIA